MTNVEKAVAQYGTDSACSQSVAYAFAEKAGLEPSAAHRLATGFGGGIGSKQYVCGAVAAGVLLLSAKYGSAGPEDGEAKAKTKELAREFVDAVEARLGSSRCLEILGTDIEDAKAKGLTKTLCSDVVRACSEELEKLL